MFKIRYLLRDIYSYIFRYIPWVIIGFLITFIIPGCEVNALNAKPTDIRSYQNSGTIYNVNTNSNFGGYTYYWATTSNKFQLSTRFVYSDNQFSSAVNNELVEVTFQIYNNQGVEPTISLGTNGTSYQCYVVNSSYEYSDSAANASLGPYLLSSAICPNVILGPNVIINAYYPTHTLATEWGISQQFSISKMADSSDISNTLGDINEQQQQTNQKLDDLNDNITSSDVDTGALDDTRVNNDNGVISSILTLPLRFFQNLVNSTTSAQASATSRDICTGITFQLPYVNELVTLPCGRELLNRMNALQFYETVGAIAGGLCMFYYLIHLGKQLSDMMTLKETRAEWGGL